MKAIYTFAALAALLASGCGTAAGPLSSAVAPGAMNAAKSQVSLAEMLKFMMSSDIETLDDFAKLQRERPDLAVYDRAVLKLRIMNTCTNALLELSFYLDSPTSSPEAKALMAKIEKVVNPMQADMEKALSLIDPIVATPPRNAAEARKFEAAEKALDKVIGPLQKLIRDIYPGK